MDDSSDSIKRRHVGEKRAFRIALQHINKDRAFGTTGLTTKDVAELTELSVTRVRNLITAGRLQAHRFPGAGYTIKPLALLQCLGALDPDHPPEGWIVDWGILATPENVARYEEWLRRKAEWEEEHRKWEEQKRRREEAERLAREEAERQRLRQEARNRALDAIAEVQREHGAVLVLPWGEEQLATINQVAALLGVTLQDYARHALLKQAAADVQWLAETRNTLALATGDATRQAQLDPS